MKKSDGSWTYFGADAAYHLQKAEKADHLVNIWGADHAGTVKRVQAAVKALTDGRVDLDVKIVQMVRLFRAGEPIKMSKRSGNFVTLADVVREVGKDVVRFMMLTGAPTRRSISTSPRWSRRRRTIRCSTSNMPMRGSPRCSARRRRSGFRSTRPADLDSARRRGARRWSSSPRNFRGRSRRRRWPMSRIGSHSTSAISPRRSIRCGTAATMTRGGAFSLKTSHN